MNRSPRRIEVHVHSCQALLVAIMVILLTLVPGIVSQATRAHAMGSTMLPRQSASVLSARSLDNLVAYTRLLGYVRYFHPSDGVDGTDWDFFAVRTMRSVEGATDAAALADQLQALFVPYAPTLRVFVTGQTPPPLPSALIPPAGSGTLVVQWRHEAFGITSDFTGTSIRMRAAMTNGQLPPGFADPGHPYWADLGGGVSALIPLALFADQQGTLPHVKAPVLVAGGYPSDDPTTWLPDIAITWNAAQHFYPYWDTLTIDWQAALRTALAAAAQAADGPSYYRAFRSMLALLNDGHVYPSSPWDPAARYSLPLNWDWVENRLIVTSLSPKAAGKIRVGDEVSAVDGRSVTDILAAPDNATGGTEAFRRWVTLQNLLAGGYDSTATLQIHAHSGATFTATLRHTENQPPRQEPRPRHTLTRLKPGIVYLDMTRISTSGLLKDLPTLVKAKGIVFDGRGYPPDFLAMINLYRHLTSTSLSTGKLAVPIVMYPDHQKMALVDKTYALTALKPRIKAKLVILINANGTVSRAEHFLVIAEGYHLGQLVGSHTAGSNGELTELHLPGGFYASWTGVLAQKPDGSQLMHVGVLPTVSVDRTVAGVIAGQDELLNRGIQVLKQELARR